MDHPHLPLGGCSRAQREVALLNEGNGEDAGYELATWALRAVLLAAPLPEGRGDDYNNDSGINDTYDEADLDAFEAGQLFRPLGWGRRQRSPLRACPSCRWMACTPIRTFCGSIAPAGPTGSGPCASSTTSYGAAGRQGQRCLGCKVLYKLINQGGLGC
ncbi:hypothetical protein THAOC_20428 [Thalassiosira oceanica]|uniref:Uncharacterized protein n=1 Tax=Thalassiosira oceanica TaxID=159749 RepID=K0SLK2_THAOC|nr:hypothetical protein THAOC_20428 [Thalassiosira oceanica]|eukprot:EJK59367.1 hypothetical protein THAOC_20428 [Thalassiosira oceanica]